MVSFKVLMAAVVMTGAFVSAPLVGDAKVVGHPVAKHVMTKAHPKKVHRKHATALATRKKLAAKSHKPLVTKGLGGKKPVVGKKVAPSKTSSGWHHHAQAI